MNLIILALANAALVITLTQSSIFAKIRHITPNTPVINIRKLIHCPYCLTHWTSILLISFASPYFYYSTFSFLDFIIEILALTALTSFFAFVLLLYLKQLDEK